MRQTINFIKNMANKRESVIECFRLFLMFGICFLHAITKGEYNQPWIANLFLPYVVGFVFISGWFGIRFSWQKVVRLYGVGCFAALVFAVLEWKVGGLSATAALVSGVHRFAGGYWFLHAYVLMMCLSPCVNAALPDASRSSLSRILPLLAIVWFWGFGRTLPIVGPWLPYTDGLQAYGGLTLLATYAAARYCRLMKIDARVPVMVVCAVLPIFGIAVSVGLGDYNSPFAFCLAASVFLLFKRMTLSRGVERIVFFVTPSLFSVYLLHQGPYGNWLIATIESIVIVRLKTPRVVGFLVAASLVFCVTLSVDLIRRAVVTVCRDTVFREFRRPQVCG